MMNRDVLYKPYSIHFETMDVFPDKESRKNFFELVFILSGTGTHCINKHSFSYHNNHMFLLTPKDCSQFWIDSTTEFFFLQFSDIYLKDSIISRENIKRLEFILENANHKPGCIIKNQTDKMLIRPIVEALIREGVNRDFYHNDITALLVNSLIALVARNIIKYLPQKIGETSESRIINILNYIQANIYDPEMIRVEKISNMFGLSENYLGKYFKKHCGETLQSYINNYKATLIEHRLKHSDMRISEIADEFGFTDDSHLNKFFKVQKGKSPRTFKIEYLQG
ncbi:AraC family transcriptional regulator [Chryseobacterium sp. OSA05B]|uniref:AraC family transcriptional regulator n=1 Tax=Chryseobacterium sp. OSA05B TaxID=2862650 RepID=UPI001CC0B183|nr:AraC family transcriptional regulator [Chryseobacterium sp. OSA05B]